jgi:hypothetical protein
MDDHDPQATAADIPALTEIDHDLFQALDFESSERVF